MLFFAAFLMVNGLIYQKFYRPPEISAVKCTGPVHDVVMKVKENSWLFDPSRVEVTAGETVHLQIYNEDSYDHGWAVEAFGVNKRLFPKINTDIKFCASKVGEYTFYCSVPCGEGHNNQKGTLVVKPRE